jgi:hypothetical protein
MKKVVLPLLLATGIAVADSRTGFPGKDALSVSQPAIQNIEQIQQYHEFWKWQKKKEKEDALKFLMPEVRTLTGSSKTLSAEQQKQLEKVSSNLVFIENKGQWHNDVLYLCRMGGLDAWITKYGVNYTFYKLEEVASIERKEHAIPDKFEHKDYNIIGHRVLMKLQNYNPKPAREGKEKQEGYYNYFIGNDPSKHASYVGLYKEVVVKDVYKGIDLRYYFDKGGLRYDYVVHPGADPSQIVFTLEGSEKTYVNEKGNLVFTTRFGEVAMAELKAYQEGDKKEIKSRFVKRGDKWRIALASYDRTQTLIIDPLVYSTYIGGSDDDEGYAIAVDGSGNAYVTGYTTSTNYDVTPGVFQTTNGGNYDVFVTKLNASGSGLVYSTYIGGSGDDVGYGIAVDGSGNAYVTGITVSIDYAVTPGAFQTIKGGGGFDVFVTKLNASGSGLVYSTYIGGSSDDWGLDIAVDGSGNAYVTGWTVSINYDVTAGAFQTTYSGGAGSDVFVTKLNASGNALVYSTYIGGSNFDEGWGIAVDGSGNAYVTGQTISTDYDVTPGAFQTTNGGVGDVFVTKLNASGSGLVYSTYIGGSNSEEGYGIAVDGSGNAYVTGYTLSTDYDVTPGAFQTTHGGGYWDVFVTKLNASGSGLVYSTYIGGSNWDEGRDIAVDGSGNAYVTGRTISTDYDVTPGAFQTTNGGIDDVFVTKLNASGSGLVYSTYIGGSHADDGLGIAVDGSGNAYVTGYTLSTDYDVTPGAFQTTYGGGTYDVFVTKLCHVSISLTSATGTDNQSVCINSSITSITYTTTGTSGANVIGLPGGVSDNYSGNTLTISGTPTVSGTYVYTVNLTGGCGSVSTTGTIITVDPINNTINLTSASGTDNQTVCINSSISNITYTTMGASGANVIGLPGGVNHTYSGNTLTISGTPMVSGTFVYTVTDVCGNISTTGTIVVDSNNTINLTSGSGTDNQTACINSSITNITYTTTGASGANVIGLPGGVSGVYAGNALFISGTPTVSGTFVYTVNLTGGCGNVSTTGTIVVDPNNTINLTSANGTDNQNVCINSSITNITYTTTGASGANVTGLPGGVSDSYSGNTLTISGTPTVSGTFVYTVNLTGGCGNVSTTGTISVGCVGIEELTNGTSWQIFPNPTRGIFTIISEKGGVFEIMDLTGRVLNVFKIETQREKVNTNLPTGMYFIREKTSGKIQKLVIE